MPTGANEKFATFVHPDEYRYYLDRVVTFTENHLVFLKRKFFSTEGHELVRIPISDCVWIAYFDERPLVKTLAGTALFGLVLFIGFALYYYSDRLGGAGIKVGALLVAGYYGFRWCFQSRQHRFVFHMADGSSLMWASPAGHFKENEEIARRALDIAKSTGRLRSSV